MLDTPDNRTRDLCIWCTSFGDGQKVRAYDAYVKKHGGPPVRIAPEIRKPLTPEETGLIAPARKPAKWHDTHTTPVKSTSTPPPAKSTKTHVEESVEIEGEAHLADEALEELKKIEPGLTPDEETVSTKKKVKKE